MYMYMYWAPRSSFLMHWWSYPSEEYQSSCIAMTIGLMLLHCPLSTVQWTRCSVLAPAGAPDWGVRFPFGACPHEHQLVLLSFLPSLLPSFPPSFLPSFLPSIHPFHMGPPAPSSHSTVGEDDASLSVFRAQCVRQQLLRRRRTDDTGTCWGGSGEEEKGTNEVARSLARSACP